MHIPNADTYRMYLGKKVNTVLFQLVEKKNKEALQELSVTDYVEKMIAHWWMQEFPDTPCPIPTKPYYKDLDFVQSV